MNSDYLYCSSSVPRIVARNAVCWPHNGTGWSECVKSVVLC